MNFEPVRFSAALSVFGVALISLAALLLGWMPVVIVAVNAVWAAGIGVFNSLFVRGQVTPNDSVPGIAHDMIVSLAPFAPQIVDAVVPVAVSPLIDGPKVED